MGWCRNLDKRKPGLFLLVEDSRVETTVPWFALGEARGCWQHKHLQVQFDSVCPVSTWAVLTASHPLVWSRVTVLAEVEVVMPQASA